MQKLTKTTALKTIQAQVLRDFNVNISREDAREIREASTRGCVTWTPRRLVNTAMDASISAISAGRINARNGATYTSAEWNE